MKSSLYTRPNKPMQIAIPNGATHNAPDIKKVDIVAVDKATECHVTPKDVASRMVKYLGPQGDYLTLEPSAGTGALATALLASGHSPNELTMIERHSSLANGLRKIGPVVNECFLEYAERVKSKCAWQRVLMNPPFKAVKKHINAAISLMGDCGHSETQVLVALVPITFDLDGAEVLEFLPNDTFSSAKVNTKIIRFYK